MLVVDLMHEFELGVWKATFIHLLRILDCLNKTHDLDQRQVLLYFYVASLIFSSDFEKFPLSGSMA
jgi:hypothetical protein